MSDGAELPEGVDENFLEQWFNDRMEREQAKKDRDRPFKGPGDVLDRLASAVVDEQERRIEERRKARDEAEQEPTRGKQSGGGFLGILGGEKSA